MRLLTTALALVVFGAMTAGASAALPRQSVANRAAARSDVARELSLLTLPAGTVRVARDPSSRSMLSGRHYRPIAPSTSNLIDVHRFWRVPGTPLSLYRWLNHHHPAGTVSSFGEQTNSLATGFSLSYNFRSTRGVGQRSLQLVFVAAKGGGTALRADGQAVWILTRAAWERIPAAARTVTMTVTAGGRPAAPTTVIGLARVRAIARFINRLPVAQPWTGFTSCPLGPGPFTVALVFRSASGSRPLARVADYVDGCVFTRVWIGGREATPLDGGDEIVSLLERLGVIAHCAAPQLRIRASRPALSVLDGSYDVTFTTLDVSSPICSVDGYPRLVLRGADGARLQTHETHQRPAPGFTTLTKGDSTYFSVSWSSGCRRSRASTVDISLKYVRAQIAVAVGSRRHPFDPCGGALTVSWL